MFIKSILKVNIVDEDRVVTEQEKVANELGLIEEFSDVLNNADM